LPNKTAQQVREELIKIKGIGNWTIDIYLMFCLQSHLLGDAAVKYHQGITDIHDKKRWKHGTMESVSVHATHLCMHHI
jgi:DNA-3-methyladenine glycosylase II